MTHEFQPVIDKARFDTALEYIASHVVDLGNATLGHELPLDTLTLFTHQDDEFTRLEPIVRKLGPESRFTHGLTLYVEPLDLSILGFKIKYLGLRRPDETRAEVGYGDFVVQNIEKLLEEQSSNEFVKTTKSGRGQSMLELRHPDFDVRAYVLEASEH